MGDTTYCNSIFSPQFLCIESACVHGVECDFTGGREDWCRLGEQVIVSRFSLNCFDEHRVASVLVGSQHCEVGE